MDGQAAGLAERFRKAVEDLAVCAEGLSEPQWQAVNEDEGLSVGAMVFHVASGSRLTRGVLAAMVRGEDDVPERSPLATEGREDLREQEAAEFERLTRSETIDLLRREGNQSARSIASLSDADLGRNHLFWAESISTQTFVQKWVDDVERHLAEAREAAAPRNS